MEIGFEDQSDTAFMFGVYTEVVGLLNQEVVASFRNEMIKGELRQCINNLSVLTKVIALDRKERVKLFVADMPDTHSNILFSDIDLGETRLNCIVYCTSVVVDSSPKAVWISLQIMDKKRNVSEVKLFDPERKTADFAGRYLKMDLRKNKYGFNATDIFLIDSLTSSANPEIDLAKNFIIQAIQSDSKLVEVVQKSNILQAMMDYLDEEEPERGYIIVRVAMEMAQALEMLNMSPIVDVELLLRAIVLNRGYVLTRKENSTRSKQMHNLINATTYASSMVNNKMLCLLETDPEVDLLEVSVYRQIRETVNILIKARRRGTYTLSTDKKWGK